MTMFHQIEIWLCSTELRNDQIEKDCVRPNWEMTLSHQIEKSFEMTVSHQIEKSLEMTVSQKILEMTMLHQNENCLEMTAPPNWE